VTSFWEKQSLLVLAAEHDRVDILKAILTDDECEKMTLMNSGIPPLHIAISFGSTNATQSLLRMVADPSIRPNVKEIKAHSEQSKVLLFLLLLFKTKCNSFEVGLERRCQVTQNVE
jgi:ankyrin repeat protein